MSGNFAFRFGAFGEPDVDQALIRHALPVGDTADFLQRDSRNSQADWVPRSFQIGKAFAVRLAPLNLLADVRAGVRNEKTHVYNCYSYIRRIYKFHFTRL